MKKNLKLILLAISAIICLSLLTACDGDGKEVTLIAKGDPAKYLCIYNASDDATKNSALLFKTELNANGLNCLPTVYGHTSQKGEFEILFGKTDRAASRIAAEFLEAESAENKDAYHWVFYYEDGKLAIVASNELAYQFAIEDFFEKHLTSTGIVFKDTLKEHGLKTYEEYDEYLDEQERLAAEEKKKEHEKELSALEALLNAQRDELSTLKGKWDQHAEAGTSNPEMYLFMEYTLDMGAASNTQFGAPSAYPTKNQHPRLLLTKDNIPLIRKMLREDNLTNKSFKTLVESELDNNGILPPANDQGSSDTLQTVLTHNYSSRHLYVIQAKALEYVLYGDEYYGYQAILYIKNYIKSLDIITLGDKCRYYGYVAFTAAIVYDWCYDLLTETDKVQLTAGVENCLFRDKADKKHSASKMEVGFPPDDQVAIAGHGNEYQVLRDYLAFSIAIYDETPSWYEHVGGRVYNDFLPARNYLYQSGMVWQGTGYTFTRHAPTLLSAWILEIATGKNPYDDVLHNAIWGFFNYEIKPGYTFSDGDKTADLWEVYDHNHLAYLAAYLYRDPDMLAMAEFLTADSYLKGDDPFSSAGYAGIQVVPFVVLRGLCELEASEDRYAKMNLIQYNGAYVGQYIVREAWGDESSAAVFMKIKERSTAGHEHMDAGTFEIYYKGMLTSDGGCYDNDGHAHSMYYHDATISHNGLLIFNDNLANNPFVDDQYDYDKGYYSGGQRRPPDTNKIALDKWLEDEGMDTGKVVGRQHGYADAAETQPLYAYIAGDITKAYEESTVSYVGRRMLTVYTGDEDFPMVFFVYDDISSQSKNFRKSFLLQITSKEAPIVEGNKIITENGDGRLVLASLSSNVKFESFGGREYNANGSYNCANSSNYIVNGEQLVTLNGKDDGHWGRVEIVSNRKTQDTTFMNVLYVTDKGNDKTIDIRKVSNTTGVQGAVFNKKVVSIFATDRNGATEAISCTVDGKGELSYYVSGVAAGEWRVTVDGKDCGIHTATAEGGLLTFKASKGEVVITPINLAK